MYFIRRLRYAIASKTLRGVMSIISFAVIALVVVITMSGAFSQRKLFTKAFYLMRDYGYSASEAAAAVLNGDNDMFILTDEGLYFRSENAPGNEIDITDNGDITINKEKDDEIFNSIIDLDSDNEESSEESKDEDINTESDN